MWVTGERQATDGNGRNLLNWFLKNSLSAQVMIKSFLPFLLADFLQ
jgi:hypothetical protein